MSFPAPLHSRAHGESHSGFAGTNDALALARYTRRDMDQDSRQGNRDGTRQRNDGAARDLLTVEQAAQYLQLSPSSIRSYIRQGKLKAFRVAGLRKVLIARAELLTLLEPTSASNMSGNSQLPAA
jgi:excisionase family DNA binding protein